MYMINKQIKKLEVAREKVAAIEKAMEIALAKELACLPAKFGFADTLSFIKAVKAAAYGKNNLSLSKRRKRAVINDETKALVKKLSGEGKTGAKIAIAAGISLPSVQNIKKELGLVRTKSKM
jgi:hypothetical protein